MKAVATDKRNALNANSFDADRMSPEHDPCLVSVIIPTRNRADLVGEAMDSVVAQSYRPLEIIVVDDGSTDDTAAVVRRREEKLGEGLSLRYIRQENAGACAARNAGVRASSGAFLKFLDSDDLLEPDALEKQVGALRESGAQVVHGDWWDVHLGSDRKVRRRVFRSMGKLSDPVTDLLARRWSANFCYLFSRSAVEASGGWDERLDGNQDFGFVLRVALAGARFVYQPGAVGVYRHHQEGRVSLENRHAWAVSTRLILEEAESALTERGDLTPERRRALAGYHLTLAKEVYGSDRPLFHEFLGHVQRLFPGFRPDGCAYRTLVRVMGYPGAEAILEVRRRMRRRLGWRR